MQKCTITGLTHITKDTSQLPQALSISQVWFPIVQANGFSPLSSSQSPPLHHPPKPPTPGPFPRAGPQEWSRKHNSYCYSCHLGPLWTRVSISRVVFSQVVAMVNMPSTKQQREKTKTLTPLAAFLTKTHRGSQKKIWFNHCSGQFILQMKI